DLVARHLDHPREQLLVAELTGAEPLDGLGVDALEHVARFEAFAGVGPHHAPDARQEAALVPGDGAVEPGAVGLRPGTGPRRAGLGIANHRLPRGHGSSAGKNAGNHVRNPSADRVSPSVPMGDSQWHWAPGATRGPSPDLIPQ